MDAYSLIFFAAGLALLIGGAELLVRGASRLAVLFGISPLVIGLTVVAFATSAPELAVNIQAMLSGQPDVALGSVVGSNIFNILFILGISSLITPLVVSKQLIRWDVPIMVLISLLLFSMGMDGVIGRGEGIVLFLGLVAYTVWAIRLGRKDQATVGRDVQKIVTKREEKRTRSVFLHLLFVAVGLGMLAVGSHWLIRGALEIALELGVSELVIGLTIISGGTSLPEVVTSIVASLRGERDIAIGNVVGSNIFNILSVIGITSIVAPNGLMVSNAALTFDIPVMVAAAIACLPIFFHENKMSRWEGALFFGYYVAYITYLFLDATSHRYLTMFSTIMLQFVIPMTVVSIGVVVIRYVRAVRSTQGGTL